MLRRSFLVVAALLASACSPVWQATGDMLESALVKPEKTVFTREQVNNLPYFQIQAETPDSRALFILTRANGDAEYWQSSQLEMLVIAHGLVLRTARLPANLEQTRFDGNNPFATGLYAIADGATATRTIDLDHYRYGIRLDSTFHRSGTETIDILGERHEVLRITETVTSPDMAFTFTNRYWVDADNHIWKSTQTLYPGFTLTITWLRPYSGASS